MPLNKEDDSNERVSNAGLKKLLRLMKMLEDGRWTIKQIVEHAAISKSSAYRYMELLTENGSVIKKDVHKRYYIYEDPNAHRFTKDEIDYIRYNIKESTSSDPALSSLLQKLEDEKSNLHVPHIFLKKNSWSLVKNIEHAIKDKLLIILKDYISANSNEKRDRRVEPIHFGDNFQTIHAFDVEDEICKTFKLDRVGDVIVTTNHFSHEQQHVKRTADLFGMCGPKTIFANLKLSLRAYLLLKEEFPLAVPFMTDDQNQYIFHGPVHNFKGIGRFIMGLLNEIEVVGPPELNEYIKNNIIKFTSSKGKNPTKA